MRIIYLTPLTTVRLCPQSIEFFTSYLPKWANLLALNVQIQTGHEPEGHVGWTLPANLKTLNFCGRENSSVLRFLPNSLRILVLCDLVWQPNEMSRVSLPVLEVLTISRVSIGAKLVVPKLEILKISKSKRMDMMTQLELPRHIKWVILDKIHDESWFNALKFDNLVITKLSTFSLIGMEDTRLLWTDTSLPKEIMPNLKVVVLPEAEFAKFQRFRERKFYPSLEYFYLVKHSVTDFWLTKFAQHLWELRLVDSIWKAKDCKELENLINYIK